MVDPVLSLENVSKFYTSASNVVVGLHNVQLTFRRGEFVAITGESGSGKSTLSNVIGGILGYESGEMLLEGKPTSHYDGSDWERYRRDNISYISQNYGILPGATVLINVISALRLAGMEKKQAKENARQILEQVELWQLRNRRAAKLSSGQKQRLSIARALAKPAPILIADEPTGNLDPENSAKVISLLAQAARTRLVLMVTHEFEEVKDCATRHICLQDGYVVADAVLRPANTPEALPSISRKTRSEMSLLVAGLQLRSRPIWTALMTLLFTLTAFAVVALSGSFVVALDDTNTRVYDSTAFLNGSPTRIVVSAPDFQPLGPEDYEALANLRYVTRLERNGYMTDAQYSYRDGVDYTTHRWEHIFDFGGQTMHKVEITYEVHANAPYMQTVPVLPQGQTFLREGRLPESFYEVVAHTRDGLQIGQTVTVFLTNRRYWADTAYLKLDFKVVGLTDVGAGLYFADDVGKFCQHVAHTAKSAKYYQILPEPEPNRTRYDRIPQEAMPEDFSYTLLDGECQISDSLATTKRGQEDAYGSLTISIPNINLRRQGLNPTSLENLVQLTTPREYTVEYVQEETQKVITTTIKSRYYHNYPLFTRLIYVNQNTFDQLCWNAPSEQVSLTIEDYAYTQRVLDAIEDLGYIGVSPYRLGATRIDEGKAAQREQTLAICLAALLAVVVLQVVVLRAMCGVQTESYRLLRNIGLVRNGAKRSILWQFLLFTVVGQLLSAGILYVCVTWNVQRVIQILRYLPPLYLAALSAVHLAAALLAAFWSIRALEKRLYPTAGRYVDLHMDEEVAV